MTSKREIFSADEKEPPFTTTYVGGFETARLTGEELAQAMVRDCLHRLAIDLPKLVFSSNGQGISLAAKSDAFRQAMEVADIIHADGMSVVIASKLLTKRALPERISTTDFFHDAARAAEANKLSFFMLGGREEQNQLAVAYIQSHYPNLRIAGRRNGYFQLSEEAAICEEIKASGADVLWVALGKPLQEIWCVRNRERLQGVGWIKTCGGLYGHLSGEEKRAPTWMRKIGGEWLFRAMQDPKRLAWRYIKTNPHALWQMMLQSGNSGHRR